MFLVALWAALAMFAQDILMTVLVQAESRNRAWLSGALDSLGWIIGIFTTTISVTAIQGHDLGLKVAVILAVSVANVIGGYTGVMIGRRLVTEGPPPEGGGPSEG